MNLQKVFFETEDGVELSGLLHTNGMKTDKVVISVHGMQSNCMKKRDDILAKNITNENIAYFCFNNRGHDLVNMITKEENGKYIKKQCGSSLENIEDSYFDIKAAIEEMLKMGYKKIYLQGHSLGCTKIVYSYTKMKKQNEQDILNKIQSISLLSMVDIPVAIKFFFNNDVEKLVKYMENEKNEGRGQNVMSVPGAIIPMSPNTFLGYLKDNNEIDFARYSDETYNFKELNDIEVPLFMRWGNKNDLIMQPAEELVNMLKEKIKNKKSDIGYIEGAGHNYRTKEEEHSKEIINFLKKI